jgi:hypothetical protein
MVEKTPAFIPQVLPRDDVSLLRADETVLFCVVGVGRFHGTAGTVRG